MTLKLLAEVSPQDLLVALAEVQGHLLGYVKSMALKCAVDLGIPEAMHRRGGSATLTVIAADAAVHPAKLADLRRLMELLTATGMFTVTDREGSGANDSGAVVYKLTTACRFLVGSLNLSPMVPFLVSPPVVSSFFSLGDWLKSEPAAAGSVFELAHGCSQWEMANSDATLNRIINDSMVADSKLFLEVIIMDKGRIFRGLSSLVDVGGGHGAATQVIAAAFPRIKCTVLDLPHVIGQDVTGDGKVRFVAGNMFESIPPATAVLLKNILHDWGDEDCIKILQRCKEAIPARNAGGKVIIIDLVIGSNQGNRKISEMEATQNMFMMYINGMERGENEWKMIFSKAGFSDDYNILPVLGPFSVIEIYPK
ncbi:hypothetical protein EJB05_40646 [Eragrostis curvula]|uniref:O-methyltransferase domain-containing protein n=1 Tax=Eragrostis curvula TaxID=38414 RepID=A0A5J9TQB7_9POAL|nr:hypothetical protein EJB05_40580 [Eragrostis curvula]TVU13586.1 hypothetical protein EJB05_40646 [Eragrostis curvula]